MQIIQKNLLDVEPDWQKELAKSFKNPQDLLTYLNLDASAYTEDIIAKRLFPMIVPRFFAELMRPNDPNDPLLKQVLPDRQEFLVSEGYSTDPLQEQGNATPGILHKYKSRVLIILKGGCAINCRYCFRRHFPYADNQLNKQELKIALEDVSHDTNINEIILSGGDPLMSKDGHLQWLIDVIEKVPHVKRLRIHTRLPVVLPQRINDSFIETFKSSRLQKIMVLHINHANEVSRLLSRKVEELRSNGWHLFNQSVLLKDINDDLTSQIELQEATFAAGIQPYYIHLMDKVQGAEHFDIPEERARKLMHQMLEELPGFLVPKMVREIGGEKSKTPIDLKLAP